LDPHHRAALFPPHILSGFCFFCLPCIPPTSLSCTSQAREHQPMSPPSFHCATIFLSAVTPFITPISPGILNHLACELLTSGFNGSVSKTVFLLPFFFSPSNKSSFLSRLFDGRTVVKQSVLSPLPNHLPSVCFKANHPSPYPNLLP